MFQWSKRTHDSAISHIFFSSHLRRTSLADTSENATVSAFPLSGGHTLLFMAAWTFPAFDKRKCKACISFVSDSSEQTIENWQFPHQDMSHNSESWFYPSKTHFLQIPRTPATFSTQSNKWLITVSWRNKVRERKSAKQQTFTATSVNGLRKLSIRNVHVGCSLLVTHGPAVRIQSSQKDLVRLQR